MQARMLMAALRSRLRRPGMLQLLERQHCSPRTWRRTRSLSPSLSAFCERMGPSVSLLFPSLLGSGAVWIKREREKRERGMTQCMKGYQRLLFIHTSEQGGTKKRPDKALEEHRSINAWSFDHSTMIVRGQEVMAEISGKKPLRVQPYNQVLKWRSHHRVLLQRGGISHD